MSEVYLERGSRYHGGGWGHEGIIRRVIVRDQGFPTEDALMACGHIHAIAAEAESCEALDSVRLGPVAA